jgi:hypothetical protein
VPGQANGPGKGGSRGDRERPSSDQQLSIVDLKTESPTLDSDQHALPGDTGRTRGSLEERSQVDHRHHGSLDGRNASHGGFHSRDGIDPIEWGHSDHVLEIETNPAGTGPHQQKSFLSTAHRCLIKDNSVTIRDAISVTGRTYRAPPEWKAAPGMP